MTFQIICFINLIHLVCLKINIQFRKNCFWDNNIIQFSRSVCNNLFHSYHAVWATSVVAPLQCTTITAAQPLLHWPQSPTVNFIAKITTWVPVSKPSLGEHDRNAQQDHDYERNIRGVSSLCGKWYRAVKFWPLNCTQSRDFVHL